MSRKYRIGDRVRIRDATSMFHTRTQAYTRGHTGVIVEYRPEWIIPEDEAWGREDGRVEPFYVVRFRQQDLWPSYTGFDADTLETEVSERWLEPAEEDAR
ncbi:SH3-like domain-containing protein [Nocardia sp. NPDC051787]|uniref:SH3-like domain-containing protein n=1 Tax=Nocardia sp. NPDC051787 TaxID=3155415 RepID=UPI0034152712